VDDEGNRTTSEWEWRWTALTQGKQFYLVNLAAINEDELLFSSVQTNNGQLAFGSSK
jgi:hypothetical protein